MQDPRSDPLEVTPSGSIRIDGGEEGFKPRTISTTDLGWVLLARHSTSSHEPQVMVTEQVVNGLRYLDGTPKESTRYIDTGWALVLTEALGWERIVEDLGSHQIVAPDDRTLNATCQIALDAGSLRVVCESRGGGGRNTDYNEGVDAILSRLAREDALMSDAYLETRTTTQKRMPLEARRLELEGHDYPVALGELEDVVAFRKLMGRAQQRVGRSPGAKGGGNSTKRFVLETRKKNGAWTRESALWIVLGDRR